MFTLMIQNQQRFHKIDLLFPEQPLIEVPNSQKSYSISK